MPTSSELRARARQQLGNSPFASTWLMGALVTLVVSLVTGVLSAVSLLIIGSLAFSTAYIYLRVARGNPNIEIEDAFSGFSTSFGRNLVLGIMQMLFLWLWSCLFIIPGIVKYYAYGMAHFLAADHPDWSWKQCLDESQRLMRGNKAKLFFLDLSFLGWILLCTYCTCGIGIFFVAPYMNAAHANFYLELLERDGCTYIENEPAQSADTGESKNTYSL